MDILNLIRISAKALLRNKTRTALSMLGIVIGIAAVIAVVNFVPTKGEVASAWVRATCSRSRSGIVS